jgi:hypothetical protein
MPVVLTGQPELSDRLNEPQLRQLKQRVALRCSLPPFDLRETAAYVAKRIRIAGGDSAAVFTREAVEAIQHGSHGIARTISVICDNALINGFALQRRPVDADVVVEVCREFELLDTPQALQAGESTGVARADVAPAHVARAGAAALQLPAPGSQVPVKLDRQPASERLAVVPTPDRSTLFGSRPDLPRPVLPDDGVSVTGGPSNETTEQEAVAAGTRRRRFLFF